MGSWEAIDYQAVSVRCRFVRLEPLSRGSWVSRAEEDNFRLDVVLGVVTVDGFDSRGMLEW
jgi:hypothetical protein